MDGNGTAYFFVFTFFDDCLRIVEKSRSLCKEINNALVSSKIFIFFQYGIADFRFIIDIGR